MTDKTKSRSAGGTAGAGQAETAACGGAAISCNYSTTGGTSRQLHVSDFLRYGRENALHLGELKQLLHKDGRTIRLMIQQERQHVPIVSDNFSGYWIGTLDEANSFARSMQVRAGEIQKAAAFVQLAAWRAENGS